MEQERINNINSQLDKLDKLAAGEKKPDKQEEPLTNNREILQALVEITRMNLQGTPQKKEAPAKKEPEYIKATFTAAFGEITAPFLEVIRGDMCIAFVQDTECSFNYVPPVSDEEYLSVSWTEGVGHKSEAHVMHPGISFDMKDGRRIIVMLCQLN